MKKEITEKVTKQNVLIYFTEQTTKMMYKHWAYIFNIPVINGDKISKVNYGYNEARQSKKVLLIITVREADERYIKKIQEIGFKNENITLFTTQYLESEMCIYAQKQGIKVVQLPLFEKQLEDYI